MQPIPQLLSSIFWGVGASSFTLHNSTRRLAQNCIRRQFFNFTELAQIQRARFVDNLGLAILLPELDLILMNINLPKISGLQITRQIERNGTLGHILVIAVTGLE